MRLFVATAALAFTLVQLVGLSFAKAEEAPNTVVSSLPLNMGDWEIGGSAVYQRNIRTNDRAFSVSPKAEYFFANRFSAGGTVVYSDINVAGVTGSNFGIGPSATYYITHTERMALSIDQSVVFAKPSFGDNYVQGATGLAFDYFVTDSIAFGPALRAYYYFNGGLNKPDDAIQLAFNFSLFL
jgi:hypothetical protein